MVDKYKGMKKAPHWMDCNCECHGFYGHNEANSCPHCKPKEHPDYVVENPEPLSQCCKAKLTVDTGDEGTSCYTCLKCGRASDPEPIKQDDYDEEGWALEFDKKFESALSLYSSTRAIDIKEFIRNLLSNQAIKDNEEFVKYDEEMEKKHKKEVNRWSKIAAGLSDDLENLKQQHRGQLERLKMKEFDWREDHEVTNEKRGGYDLAVERINKAIDELLKQ